MQEGNTTEDEETQWRRDYFVGEEGCSNVTEINL